MSQTISEDIMQAVAKFMVNESASTFREEDIAQHVELRGVTWDSSYAAVFEGMLSDRPSTAQDSGVKYRNVFQRIGPERFTLTAYGKELLEQIRRQPRSSETLELPKVEEATSETMDGLRAWQAAIVRLWSADEDAFAELTMSWLPDEAEGAPWIARLYCGDHSDEGWIEDVRIFKATSIQQGLQRLWDRAKVRHGLFKDDLELTVKVPTDFPADLWLTTAERALIDRTISHTKRALPKTALRLAYHPDRRLSLRWTATLHPFSMEPPEGALHEVHAATLLQVTNDLLRAMLEQYKTVDAEASTPEMRALMERKTDVAIEPLKLPKQTDSE